MSRKKHPSLKKEKKPPAYETAMARLQTGVLSELARHIYIRCDESHPMAKTDWAYIDSRGHIYLNPRREASVSAWEYVLAHCMLHLGLGHFVPERLNMPLWQRACDMAVLSFIRDSKIAPLPLEYQHELPISAKSAEQAWELLKELPADWLGPACGTMSGGRPGMVWAGKPDRDYEALLAESFQRSIRKALREVTEPGDPDTGERERKCAAVFRARDWFVASYPLLGAIAANFRIVEDMVVLRREGVEVAAISPQLGEIYVNPNADLAQEEWKFVLAHEFLHAALRHDVRCEDRNPALWNVACDFVINAWLLEMGVGEMPEWALYEDRFKNMTAEAVYDLMGEDPRYYLKIALGDLLCGDPRWWDGLSGQELDAFYREAIQQGLAYHKASGRWTLPSGLVEEIYAVNRPPIRWDVALAKWFDEQFQPVEKRRTYARLSRRQSATPDIPRPAWYLQEAAVESRIYGVLLDTSGSMERALLAAALGSIASYSESRDVHHVRVVFCDAAAYDQGVMDPADIAGAVKVRGRGGTVLQPGIDLLDGDPNFPKDAPLLIITDGMCDRLKLHGRKHAFLIPWGNRLPFSPKGPVFRLR